MKIATKCDPTSRSRDKFDITEILVSLKIGMLSHENVPRNDLLIFSSSYLDTNLKHLANSFYFLIFVRKKLYIEVF